MGWARFNPAHMTRPGPLKKKLLGWQSAQHSQVGLVSAQPKWLGWVRSSPLKKKKEGMSVGPPVGPTQPS